MSEFSALRITRSRAGQETKNRVLLGQEPWDPYIGMLTVGGLWAYIRQLLYGEGEGVQENCGADEAGLIGGVVYAYPDPAGLVYDLGISHGDPGPRIETELKYAELLQVQNETEPSLRYPTDEIYSAVWVTDALAKDGETLPRPAISIAGGRVRTATPTYGTILAIYKVVRHTYQVWISPRPTAAENKYQSFIYAVWDGGNNYIEYQPPADAEDGGRCNNLIHYGEGGTTPSGDCEPPRPTPQDINYDVDYCSGEVT